MTTRVRTTCLGIMLALVLASSACSGGKANVTGKIQYNGKAVMSGGVSSVGPDGLAVPGSIDSATGQYTLTGVTAGKVKIGVSSPPPALAANNPGAVRGAAPKAPPAPKDPNWFAIPDKFGDPEKSGVVIEVKSGSNSIDITLK